MNRICKCLKSLVHIQLKFVYVNFQAKDFSKLLIEFRSKHLDQDRCRPSANWLETNSTSLPDVYRLKVASFNPNLINNSGIFVGRIRNRDILPGEDVQLLEAASKLGHVVDGDGDVRDDLLKDIQLSNTARILD